MKNLLVIAIFVGMCAFALAAPACDEKAVNQSMSDCFSKNGIDLAKFMKLVPKDGKPVDVDEDFYTDLCSERDGYNRALQCMTMEFNRCFGKDGSFMPDIDKVSHMMDMMCNDPKFSFKCMVEVSKNSLVIQNCLKSKIDFQTELKTKTMQQVICESSEVGIKCAVDMMTKCDAYTAQQFEKYQRMSLPKGC